MGLHLAAAENKDSHFIASIRLQRRRPVANSIIFGKDNPAALTYFQEPIFIWRILGKVIVVNFDSEPALAKLCRDYFLT